MLSKKFRLNLSDSDNRRILREGQREFVGAWRVSYDFAGKSPQAAVVIPKVIIPSAVERNALRRNVFSLIGSELTREAALRVIFRLEKKGDPSLSSDQILFIFGIIRKSGGEK